MPFLSIWTQPTKTIHYLLEKRSVKLTLLLWFLAAVTNAPTIVPNLLQLFELQAGTALMIAFFISFISMLIGWFINAGIYYGIGRMLGGSGRYDELLWLVPVATLPLIWVAPVNYIVFAITGGHQPNIMLNGSWTPFFAFLIGNLITIGVGIYSIVVTSKGLGIVHRFSAWRGFGVIAIVMLFFFLFITALVFFLLFFVFTPY
ncbi:Yip1 family protein [Sporosarcina sp. Te-1]|uniref:Yip1 family protein n=1 Tax=Sporosarcina sp. Te-1 TaxID=2818390 RepID=UPI001A9F02C0|nr:Yip1 family protein [Sporosarcina sp. Te-1]QTD39552.1 YIP1 family protein [Sporosarcina sp. Te-1]